MTGGKFQISTHAAGELMPAFGVVDGVQNATVEMRAHRAVLLLRQGRRPSRSAARSRSA